MDASTVETELDPAAVDELRASLSDELVQPADPGYDERRAVWNGSIDRHPALIARCANAADVIAALRFAERTGLPLAVRGGGHSFPGQSVCDGGVVIDLGPMKGIRVDPDARRATAQAGVLLGELDQATQQSGLVVPAGIVTHTGLAGLTLGGGIGWVMRKYGLTVDQLLAAEVVTAAGEIVRASADENPDLFWAIRGGGGNFGVVTSFEFRLHEVDTVIAGPTFWTLEQSAEVLSAYREFIGGAPRDLNGFFLYGSVPPGPQFPE